MYNVTNHVQPLSNFSNQSSYYSKSTFNNKENNNSDIETIALQSIQTKPIIKTKIKQTLNTGGNFFKSMISLMQNAVASVRNHLIKPSLQPDNKYPAPVNDLIKHSQTTLFSKPTIKAALQEFRKELSEQLKQVENEENYNLESVLERMEKSVVFNKNSENGVTSFLDAIRYIVNKPEIPSDLQSSLAQFSSQLPIRNQERMEKLGPSMSLRDTKRTPMDVLTNLIAELSTLSENLTDSKIADFFNKAKQALLSHQVTLNDVKQLLNEVKQALQEHPHIQELCDKLLNDLPAEEKDLVPTQIYENIYGRVLDSSFASKLVDSPPQAVIEEMNQVGIAQSDFLEKLNDKQKEYIGKTIQHHLTADGDPRFWFPKTDIATIRDADSPREAFDTLNTFLRKECQNGIDVIARPYLMVKISLALVDARAYTDNLETPKYLAPEKDWTSQQIQEWRKEGKEITKRNNAKMWETAPWMENANVNYAVHISPRKNVIDITPKSAKQEDDSDASLAVTKEFKYNNQEKVGGITLSHQQPIIKGDWMDPSVRPLKKNRANFELLSSDKIHAQPLQVANRHGLVWVSGASGSTNILLHQFQYLKNSGLNLDISSYLLSAVMFLVYDGGHSIQEVLYVANQLNETLGLNLNISSSKEKTEKETAESFIADYSKFASYLPQGGAEAMENALEELINYFHKNSYYSSTNQN